MPAKNLYHEAVVAALRADGWTVTDDPLRYRYLERNVLIDLGAEENTFTAEKQGRVIAVEVQTFGGPSDVQNLQHALGQYSMYRHIMSKVDPDRELVMAVHEEAADGVLAEPFGADMLAAFGVRLLVFDAATRRVVRWTN